MTHLRQREESAPTEGRRARGTRDGSGMAQEGAAAGGAPRWVLVLGIVVALAVVLLLFVLHLTGVLGPGAH